MSEEPLEYRQLISETSGALEDLRRRLRPLIDRLMPEGYSIRSFSRGTGLELTSAWRCWTVAHVADPSQALRAMPGRKAWSTITALIEDRLGTSRELDALHAAIERVESLLRDRRLNRDLLRALAAGGLDSSREIASLLKARRASMRSAAKLYGVHCKTRISLSVLAPGSRPGQVSCGIAGCFDRIARTRPGLPWPILDESVSVDPKQARIHHHRPLGEGEPLPSVIRSISSRGIVGAELRPSRRHDRQSIALADVAPERSGQLRMFHAEVLLDAAGLGDTAESFVHTDSILLPTELFVFDLLVHRGIARYTEPTTSLHATNVVAEHLVSWNDAIRLPLEVNVERISSLRLPARLSSLDPGYRKTVDATLKALDARLEDFEPFRLVLPYPPFLSMVATGCELKFGERPS